MTKILFYKKTVTGSNLSIRHLMLSQGILCIFAEEIEQIGVINKVQYQQIKINRNMHEVVRYFCTVFVFLLNHKISCRGRIYDALVLMIPENAKSECIIYCHFKNA